MKPPRHHVAILVLFIAAGCSGPLGPIPGGALGGAAEVAPSDWSFAKDADHIQLETTDRTGDAYSVNVWSGVVDGRLFVPTSLVRGAEEPEERGWVKNAVANSKARVRIDGKLYSGVISRVLEPTLEQRVKQALLQKYASDADARVTRAWIFEITAIDNG